MLLAVDIGNTTVCLAVIRGLRPVQTWRRDTDSDKKNLQKRTAALLLKIKKNYPGITDVMICSVVPTATAVLKATFFKTFGIRPKIFGSNIKVPMINRYRNPREVGQDRLVGAYAAKILYGFPSVIIDLGTAVTFDVVSNRGEYLGGAIVPGIRLSAESLYRKTALLPKIKIRGPKGVIGRTTEESILSGIFHGYGVLCAGMVRLFSRQMGTSPKVILTGGHSSLMRRYIPMSSLRVDQGLVLKGMALIHRKV